MTETRPAPAPWNWPAVIMFLLTTVPAVTVLPWYAWKYGFDAFEWIAFVLLWGASGMAITAGLSSPVGASQLRGFEAAADRPDAVRRDGAAEQYPHVGVRVIACIIAMSMTSTTIRIRPSAAYGSRTSAGCCKNYPSGIGRPAQCPRSREPIPIVRFQHDHYLALALAMNFGVALPLGWWHGDVWGSLLLAGFVRIVVSHHCTFFINSLAHYWGRRPYTTENTARDNDLLAFFTYGEGYHNYHHLFQWDYRNGVRWWQYDPTKWLIATCAYLGLARSLKRVPEVQIRQALVERQLQQAQGTRGAVWRPRPACRIAGGAAARAGALRQPTSDWATLQQERLTARPRRSCCISGKRAKFTIACWRWKSRCVSSTAACG